MNRDRQASKKDDSRTGEVEYRKSNASVSDWGALGVYILRDEITNEILFLFIGHSTDRYFSKTYLFLGTSSKPKEEGIL